MMIASGILKVAPRMVDEVLAELEMIPKVTTQGVYREDHVVFVVEGFDLEQLQRLRKFLLQELPAIQAATPISGTIAIGSPVASSDDSQPSRCNESGAASRKGASSGGG